MARKPEPRLRTVVALAAEMRLSQKAAVDRVARVNLDLGAAKSPRHVRAARARWNAKAQDKYPIVGHLTEAAPDGPCGHAGQATDGCLRTPLPP